MPDGESSSSPAPASGSVLTSAVLVSGSDAVPLAALASARVRSAAATESTSDDSAETSTTKRAMPSCPARARACVRRIRAFSIPPTSSASARSSRTRLRSAVESVRVCGSTPAKRRAAASRPSSSPPSTRIHVRPSTSRMATTPSPASSEVGSTPGDVSPDPVSPARPITIGIASPAGPRAMGRSIAIVSKPRRAAISAAAAVAATEGEAPRTREAFTRSGTLSPLVSSTRLPSSNIVARSIASGVSCAARSSCAVSAKARTEASPARAMGQLAMRRPRRIVAGLRMDNSRRGGGRPVFNEGSERRWSLRGLQARSRRPRKASGLVVHPHARHECVYSLPRDPRCGCPAIRMTFRSSMASARA